MKNYSQTFCIACFFTIFLGVNAQKPGDSVKSEKKCEPKEIQEILFKKEAGPPDTARKTRTFLLPYVAYNPTKGFQLGAGGTLSWYFGK